MKNMIIDNNTHTFLYAPRKIELFLINWLMHKRI